MSTGDDSRAANRRDRSIRLSAHWPNIAAAAAGIGLVLFVHRDSPRTLLSAHGFLHSAILQRFLDGFSFAPENPFFAGEPLGYYWFYQSLGAGVSRLTGLDPLHSFELLVCLGIALMVACASALAVALYRSAAIGALIAFLVVAGANAQAPLLLAYRALRSGGSVLDERPEYLWGIVHSLSSQIRYADPFGMHGPLINFFFNVTARPLALCSVMGVLLAFQRALARPSATRLVVLGGAAALTSALSVLAGIAVAGSLSAALVLLRLAARTRWAEALDVRTDDGAAARIVAALLAGLLAASPTWLQLFARGSGGAAIAAGGLGGVAHELVVLLAACWLSLGLALLGLGFARQRLPASSGAETETGSFLLVLATAALGLIGGTALVSLPVGNEDNFFHVGLVMLAVAAPAAAIGNTGRIVAARGWAIALAFAPTLALVVFCYVGRPALPLSFDGSALIHTDPDRAGLYAFIRRQLPADAVFVIDNSSSDVTMSGNTAELPALTERMLFVVRDNHYIARAYPDIGRRAQISAQLFAGATLSEADTAYIAALDRPIYIVDYQARSRATREANGAGAANETYRLRTQRDGAPVFERGHVSLHRFEPNARTREPQP